MPTFIKPESQGIDAKLPNVAVVNNVPSNTVGNNIALLGNAAVEGYKTRIRSEAQRGMEGQLDKLNQDLQTAEDAGDMGEYLNNSFKELAKIDPSIVQFKDRLGSFKTAEQQKAGVLSLLQLRAEAEMKKTIRKAPGMRKEITSIAAGILGRDPTGAMVNSLLSTLKTKADPSPRKTSYQLAAEQTSGNLVDEGFQPIFDIDGELDVPANASLWSAFSTAKRDLEAAEKKVIKTDRDEADLINAKLNMYTLQVNNKTKNIIKSYLPLVSQINSNEDYEAFKTQAVPAISELIGSIENSVEVMFANMPNSSKGKEFIESRKEGLVNSLVGPLQRILDSEDYTVAKQRSQVFDHLTNNIKMEVSEADESLRILSAVAPGVLNTILPLAMASDGELSNMASGIYTNFNNASVEDIKKMDMRAFTNLISVDNAIDQASTEERINMSKKAFKITKELFSKYDWKSAENGSHDIMARTLGTSFKTIGYGDAKSQSNFTNMIVGQDLGGVVQAISDKAENGKVKAGILADNTNEYLFNYTKRTAIPDLSDTKNHPYYSGSVGYVLDTSTGRLVTERTTPSKKTVNSPMMENIEYKAAKDKADKYNGIIDTLYSLREYSPKVAELSKGELAQVLFGRDLKSAGISFRGEEYVPPIAVQSSKEDEVSLSELIRKVSEVARTTARQL